jgi:hypothetical protein
MRVSFISALVEVTSCKIMDSRRVFLRPPPVNSILHPNGSSITVPKSQEGLSELSRTNVTVEERKGKKCYVTLSSLLKWNSSWHEGILLEPVVNREKISLIVASDFPIHGRLKSSLDRRGFDRFQTSTFSELI